MSKGPTADDLKKLVNDKLSIVDLLYKYNPTGSYHAGQTCFCPFHDNTHTPAAAIYDNDGKQTLWCFTERKTYTPADVIDVLLKKSSYVIGEKLWHNLTPAEQLQFLNEQNSMITSFDLLPENTEEKKDLEKYKTLFKYGKITLDELLKEFL